MLQAAGPASAQLLGAAAAAPTLWLLCDALRGNRPVLPLHMLAAAGGTADRPPCALKAPDESAGPEAATKLDRASAVPSSSLHGQQLCTVRFVCMGKQDSKPQTSAQIHRSASTPWQGPRPVQAL